ncbi:MAG: triosephosphate isomerase [Acidimicrobiaceae bacterium]|nr:triosephosphate isomerase [Acidimicrobiaceae bacterium]MDQ1368640.1 triosephosphate isomerase [Acidimicrobiaceae bacterium]MDQ1412155.1 triosephosphate isomerase [Acidimicrobiaceae bacterium]MDQ1415681.1 triosephosphate isomerase [Acidimicrobiaceae bacterium]MDQ1419499.1 triosephosphate isomerase [Acidimicrobiaceae bacterium]
MAESVSAPRRPFISGNWKMHHTHLDAIAMVQKLSYLLTDADYQAVDVSIHPAFTALRSIQTVLDADQIPIALGAQNCHWESKGAYTGEISPLMLAKLNVAWVIVGHSERRQLFGETDEWVNRKAKAVFAAGMTPIVCCGETLEERQAGSTESRCLGQVSAGLEGLTAEQVAALVIAYEPIWAIGTGVVATPEDAQAVIGAIRVEVGRLHGAGAAAAVRIQYGGSVKPGNIAELMAQPDIDGALVGGASLEAEDFSRLVRYRLT